MIVMSDNNANLIWSGNYSLTVQSSPLLDFAFMDATKKVGRTVFRPCSLALSNFDEWMDVRRSYVRNIPKDAPTVSSPRSRWRYIYRVLAKTALLPVIWQVSHPGSSSLDVTVYDDWKKKFPDKEDPNLPLWVRNVQSLLLRPPLKKTAHIVCWISSCLQCSQDGFRKWSHLPILPVGDSLRVFCAYLQQGDCCRAMFYSTSWSAIRLTELGGKGGGGGEQWGEM